MPHAIIGHLGFLAGSASTPAKRAIHARASCDLASGDLYTSPAANSEVDSAKPLTFTWNPDCTLGSQVDLALYEPAGGFIHGWSAVDFSKGEYTVNLQPSWWNNTASASVQLFITKTGAPSRDTAGPPGPVFKIAYDASVTTTVNGQIQTSARVPTVTNGGDAIMQTVASENHHKGLAKGAIAAAVVVPIIALAVIAGVAIRFWRAREAEKRRRWSAAVSTHSGLEWEKGARPGDKPSSILDRPATQYSFRPGSMATSSVYAVENNMAGAGAGGNFPRPSFQHRTHSSESLNSGNPRQSRISFAENTRPDRRSRASLGDSLRPKISNLPGGSRSATDLVSPGRPSIYASGSAIADDDEEHINVSPSQAQGPDAFADADMKRAQGNKTGRRSFLSLGGGDKRRQSTASVMSADDFKSAASARGSVDELRDMEAVMLMRRSMISQHSKGSSPAPEAQQEHIEALDHDESNMPQSSLPAAVGSGTVAYGPDQMLAVYAARGKVSAAPMPALPAPGDMRSFVHLNTCTMSSAAVGALPAPGPHGSSLSVPTLASTGRSNARLSGSSEISTYSEDADVG